MYHSEKTIEQIAAQLGLSGGNVRITKEQIEKLEGKSDAQLVAEIVKIREQLKKNNISVEKQIGMLKSIMPVLDDNQKARLSKIIELLSRN